MDKLLSKFGGVISLKAASVCQRLFKPILPLKPALVPALLLFALTGCDQTPASVGKELSKSSEMLEALKPKVPAGMPLETARNYMLSQGFKIEEKKAAKFKGKGPFDFLFCTRDDGDPPIKRRWEVAVIYNAKGVASLDCRTALLYP